MKKSLICLFCVLLVLCANAVSKADLLSDYGVNISDANQYSDGNTLFQLFNNYFADQLGTSGLYSSSNDLFNDRGVDPTTDWTTSGSQLVGAFKVAAFGHEMSITDQNGNAIGSIVDIAGTTNIHSANGITDLSGSSVTDIADGLHVNFNLTASAWGTEVYSWSSDPTANDGLMPNGTMGDGMIHMIAFDITDLYNEKYGTEFDSVYMMGWEDMHKTGAGIGNSADWDYQDFVAIVTNIKPNSSATPEPATALIFLLGGGAASVVAWRKRRGNV